MVVFTCSHCGESVQKPKVEKHYETKCRNKFPDLCCMDCLKDFRGDEFTSHTKCVSEAERYGGKGYIAKPNQNKGEKKQNAWIEIVQSVLDENTNLSGSLRYLLEKISKQPNTPRKQSKFVNFVRSMDRRAGPKDIENAWNLLSSKLSLVNVNVKQNGNKQNEAVENDVKKIDETSETKEEKPKHKKKKNNLENGDNSTLSNGHSLEDSTMVVDNDDENKKRKKKKKQDSEIKENASNEEITNMDTSCIEEMANSSIKKKKKAKLENYSNEENIDINLKTDCDKSADDKPLSKKEKKEKKKREKYEAELAKIQNEVKPDIEEEVTETKKTKKRKLDQMTEIENVNGENKVSEVVVESKDEPAAKKNKVNDSESFDWVGAIQSVLSSKGKEISIKKLEKKVLTEYCALNNVSVITDRINKKFTKSLKKIENIKINNEKVCLM